MTFAGRCQLFFAYAAFAMVAAVVLGMF